ncbi:hypothetical protein I317_05945 [Kwoniella heveanensis CBS 569]|nr:hypothetical protein I317_05945 [Kwoniella heveanensis CBS 569]
MAYDELSLPELIGRAYARAVPAKKLVKLVQSRLSGSNLEETDDQLAAALIPYLLPSPPSLLLSYLSELLTSHTPLLTTKTIFIHLLFYIAEHDIPPIPSLLSVSTILASSPLGLEEGYIPSLLTIPNNKARESDIPEVGTSASASTSTLTAPKQISTLSLLLPLLRICASTPPSPLSNLVGRAILHLSPFPAPSLDVGLEAGQLLPSLPEEISVPLRSTLSGLMADLATQDMQSTSALASADPGQDSQMAQQGSQQVQNAIRERLPLSQTLALLLERARRASRWHVSAESDASTPQPGLLDLLRTGPSLEYEPTEFMSTLLQVSLKALLDTSVDGSSTEAGEWWNLVMDGVLGLIAWWKTHPEGKFPFPEDIPSLFSMVFNNLSQQMTAFSEAILLRYATLVQQSESEDDSSAFTPVEGWSIRPMQETLLSRLVQLGIIATDQATIVAPGVPVHPFTPGESLLNRLAAESHHHLPPLAHVIQFAAGASSSFASDLLQTVKACPSIPPPENLFTFVASQPTLITALTGSVSPAELGDLLVKHLLDAPLDESTRMDDPQGSLTRFGEGVVLVEAVVAHFELPLPPLLVDARSAWSYSHLSNEDKETMNGWVKAIFGSDGIEDQILLATSPQTMYKLAPTLIQQAIAATTTGQMDLDTLHSGLSYFSQPLLSWCLGGVVSWLCHEIRRQGLLSALHLVVLQDLILGHTCPEPLLRVNSDMLNNILSSTSGHGDVFQSSNFDVLGIRSKLDSIGLTLSPIVIETPLRTALQVARQLDLAPAGWDSALLDALSNSIAVIGEVATVKKLMDEIALSSTIAMPMTGTADSLTAFIPLLFSLRLSRASNPLVQALIRGWLPDLCQHNQTATSISGELIGWVVKRSLVLASDISGQQGDGQVDANEALDTLVNDLMDELEYELSRLAPRTQHLARDQQQQQGVTDGEDAGSKRSLQTKTKGSKRGGTGDASATGKREMIEGLIKLFRDDEDLRARFGSLRRLDGLL